MVTGVAAPTRVSAVLRKVFKCKLSLLIYVSLRFKCKMRKNSADFTSTVLFAVTILMCN